MMATTATQNPTTTQSSSSNSPILKMNNQKILQTENKIIVENNKYEVNFKNNKLQICNKNTYNCNIIYKYTGNSNNIVVLINKEGYLNITDKDTNTLLWTTQKTNIDNNKNNFFNISNDNDNKFTLLINDLGDLQIIDTTNNSIKWSALVTQAIVNAQVPKTTYIPQFTTKHIPLQTQSNLNSNILANNDKYDDYNIGMMLKGNNNKHNLNDFIAKNTLLGNNLYISPMNQSGFNGNEYEDNIFKKSHKNIDSTFTPMIALN